MNGKCHCHPGYQGVRCERGKRKLTKYDVWRKRNAQFFWLKKRESWIFLRIPPCDTLNNLSWEATREQFKHSRMMLHLFNWRINVVWQNVRVGFLVKTASLNAPARMTPSAITWMENAIVDWDTLGLTVKKVRKFDFKVFFLFHNISLNKPK